MPSDPQIDDINATTWKHVYPRVIQDNFFRNAPILAYFRDHCLVPFGGGAFIQSSFLYQPTNGGAYAMGDSFDISAKQLFTGFTFDVRLYEQNVTIFSEQVEILNKGPMAFFDMLKGYLGAAMNTISAQINLDTYFHGQVSGTNIAANRVKNLNGLLEAANDGVTPGWNGDIFTTYGNQPRNGVITDTANSIPFWNGDQLGNTQPLIYDTLELFYQSRCRGEEEPDLMWGNRGVYSFAKSRMQVQQRFTQEKDPYWGVTGFRFNNAMFLRDDYAPSAAKRFGKNQPGIGNWTTTTFTTTAITPAAASNMPAGVATLITGEVLVVANTRKIFFEVTNSRLHGFGFTGFKVAADSTRYSGQILAGCNTHVTAPWAIGFMFGID